MSASHGESGSPRAGKPRHVEPAVVAKDVARVLEAVVPALLGALHAHARLIDDIKHQTGAVVAGGGTQALPDFTAGVAKALEPPMKLLFNDVTIHLFPPGIEFGKGENTVRVSPTVGSSVGPDGRASAGVQVDVNPQGAGGRYVGQLTVSVDVDESGRATGGSVGWKCTF